ncbi:hypothetical protein DFH09DRAFT_1148046 [Mycena vulgaris]|nr:hypothetical protein DFH09DRAFT_1148046 [Mycena vulgaris]
MFTSATELRKRLRLLDAEIAQHESSLRLLREVIAHHELSLPLLQEARKSIIEALIYPVLTLPFEITSRIFLDCLPQDADTILRPYPSQNEAPLVLTRVCRDWRAVAVSTPMLWTHLRIELDSDDGRGHIDSKWVALLDIWLQRSQPHPLSMTVSNLSYTEPDETLVGVLDRHSPRWRDLTLKLPFNHFSRLSAHVSLPLLERLTISAHGSPDMINPISAFRNAPRLNHVCLEGGMHPSDLLLPWDQLRTMEFYGASSDDCLELLRLTPNVVSCVLDIQYASHALAQGAPLQSLRSFTFSGPAGWGILRYVAMPALQKLDLTRSPPDPRNIVQLLQFVARSECALRELRLYVRSAVTTQTIYLLRCLPLLSTLDLILAEADIGTAIFREFRSSDNGASLVPEIQSISLRCVHGDNHQLMFDVITEALYVRSGLSSFTLSMDDDGQTPSPEIRDRWRVLSEEGMKLQIGNAREQWI